LHYKNESNEKGLLRAHERIDKLEDSTMKRIEELNTQLKCVSDTQIRMEEKLNVLIGFKGAGN